MRTSMVGMVVVIAVLVGGCSANNGGKFQGVSNNQAQEMKSGRTTFEKSEDPPINAETFFAAGQLNETQGNFDQAIHQYELALKQNPKHVPSLFRIGLVQSQQKNYPAAMEAWKKYITATNGAAVGYSNLAFCQELSGDAT